jgi:hypothetical protein
MTTRRDRVLAALRDVKNCPRTGQGWDRSAQQAIFNAIEIMARDEAHWGEEQTRWLLSWAENQLQAILDTVD